MAASHTKFPHLHYVPFMPFNCCQSCTKVPRIFTVPTKTQTSFSKIFNLGRTIHRSTYDHFNRKFLERTSCIFARHKLTWAKLQLNFSNKHFWVKIEFSHALKIIPHNFKHGVFLCIILQINSSCRTWQWNVKMEKSMHFFTDPLDIAVEPFVARRVAKLIWIFWNRMWINYSKNFLFGIKTLQTQYDFQIDGSQKLNIL